MKVGYVMDNNYNYYNPDGNNQSGSGFPYGYGGGASGPQPDGQRPERPKKPKKGFPKAVAVTGFAILFGIVASAVFLTSNIIGTRILGLDSSSGSRSASSSSVSSGTSLSRSSSVVTSDVSDVVDKVMPSVVLDHQYVGRRSAEFLRRGLTSRRPREPEPGLSSGRTTPNF